MGFILDFLEDLCNEFCVDDEKIFVMGMFVGGGFVDMIVCNEMVGREFVVFVLVVGFYYIDNDDNYKDCKLLKLVYMIFFYGEKDESVLYDGG